MMPPDQESADILSQSDIDRLMNESLDSPEGLIIDFKGKRYDPDAKVSVESYDFRNPVFLTEHELRNVRIRHEKFIHYLSARLSMFLRMDFNLTMSKLHTCPYSKFVDSLPSPTFICMFKMDPLAGVGVMNIHLRLAMTMVDRVLGGGGHSVKDERYLTEIEMNLMDDTLAIIMEEWCRQWEEEQEITTTIIGRENNGRFLQTSPQDAIILVLAMEASFGDCSEEIQIGIPYYSIESIIKRMQAKAKKFSNKGSQAKVLEWRESYGNVPVPVYAEWDVTELSVRDLLAMRPGDVIEVSRDIVNHTRLRFRDCEKFQGRIGIENDYIAVEVTESLMNQPREEVI